MDYKKLVTNLINNTITLDSNKLKRIRVIYRNKKYKFDDFIKVYQLDKDPIELFENLIKCVYRTHPLSNFISFFNPCCQRFFSKTKSY